ncbi:hypothetical protein ACEPAF_4522 [Sanghuangporus sanghuang]
MFSPSPRPATPAGRIRSQSPLQTPRQRRVTPGPSRLAGNASRAPPVSRMSVTTDASADSNAMDVDGGVSQSEGKLISEVVFAQSEEQKITLLSPLPVEVLQVLRNTDFVSDSFVGDVDTRNSFCLIASVKTCFVWKYAQLLPGVPTCYIFPCPNRYSEPEVPFCALLSFGPSREPGLILLSSYGELRFWDSISLGLTGGEATDDSLLDLRSDETLTGLLYAEPQKFIATSSTGRLFLFSVTSSDGRFRISSHPFSLTRPQGTVERLRIGFWGDNTPKYTPGWIVAAAVTDVNDDGFQLWSCSDMKISRWSVYHKGWEQFESEEDIEDRLVSTLRRTFPPAKDIKDLDLELLDIAFDAQKNLVLFSSFNAGYEDVSGMDTRPRRYYIIVRLKRGETLEVTSIRTVPYQTISSDRANIHPRMRLMSGGQLYGVQFGDAVAFVARDNDYSNILTLKNLQDRTFGCGVADNSKELLFMNSEVLMRVEMDIQKINSYSVNAWRGTSVKSIMTQAILFGSNPKNPLLFTFPPDVDEESLIIGAEQLSCAVLASDPQVVRPNPDLTQQILERKERLRFLIHFINENAVLSKMSQTSRQRLATDAEKLYANQELWLLYCERINIGYDEHILCNAIVAYMEGSHARHYDDDLRAFFGHQTREIGDLLPYIRQVVEDIIRNYELAAQIPDALHRGIDHVLTILSAAWSYREANLGVYGISGPMLNPWTSTSVVVKIVLDFFNLSDELFTKFPPESENEIIRATREQFPVLGETVLRCFRERLEWLESPAAADEVGNENEKRSLRERFQQVRPHVLHTLFKHGQSRYAFELAEKFRDFRSLVDLCHSTPPIYPTSSSVYSGYIKAYIEKYKEEFTDELYLWYIEHAELRCIFEQSDVYEEYIDAFFEKHPYPNISWVHDLGKGNWASVSTTLLPQIEQTMDLETRHVMLSIGKLAQIIEGEKKSKSPETQAVLDAYHDGLDYVSVHHKLFDELRAFLEGSKAKLSLDSQVDIIIKGIAPSLKAKTHPGFCAQLKSSVKELLQDRALKVEDLVDVLTLKESTLDFEISLELVKEARDIPEARQLSAYRTVWRRIYIRDDWESISKTTNRTDTQLVERFRKTALYATVRDELRRARDEQNGVLAPSDLVNTPNIVLPLNEVAQLPTREELASRWPGHSEEQLDALENDYKNEQQRLESFDLAPIVERVKKLAVQELEDELEMDDVAMGVDG